MLLLRVWLVVEQAAAYLLGRGLFGSLKRPAFDRGAHFMLPTADKACATPWEIRAADGGTCARHDLLI